MQCPCGPQADRRGFSWLCLGAHSVPQKHVHGRQGKKNQADAAAGKLLDRAGLGKQHGACGQVGGPTASHWQGGVGEGNPTKGCPGSASSTESRPVASGRTELAGATQNCHESGKEGAPGRGAPREGKVGALLVTQVQPGAAQPPACLLLCLPCLRAASPMGRAVLVHCLASLLGQE